MAGRPYATVADLAKAGVPKNTIEKITSMVTVGPSGAVPAPRATPAATPAPPAPSAATSANTPAVPTAAQQPPVKGLVWVNLETKVSHREGDRYYGHTKNGKFMTEADAVTAGYRRGEDRDEEEAVAGV